MGDGEGACIGEADDGYHCEGVLERHFAFAVAVDVFTHFCLSDKV